MAGGGPGSTSSSWRHAPGDTSGTPLGIFPADRITEKVNCERTMVYIQAE